MQLIRIVQDKIFLLNFTGEKNHSTGRYIKDKNQKYFFYG